MKTIIKNISLTILLLTTLSVTAQAQVQVETTKVKVDSKQQIIQQSSKAQAQVKEKNWLEKMEENEAKSLDDLRTPINNNK